MLVLRLWAALGHELLWRLLGPLLISRLLAHLYWLRSVRWNQMRKTSLVFPWIYFQLLFCFWAKTLAPVTCQTPHCGVSGCLTFFGTKQTFCLWPKQCYFRQSASWNLFKDKVQQAMPCFLILVQTGSLEGKSFTTLRFHMCVCIGVKIPLDFLSTFVPCVCVCACVRGKRPDFLSTFVPRVCVCVHACVRAKLAAINITMSERENLWDRVSLLCHQEKMFRYFSEKGDWKILCSCI